LIKESSCDILVITSLEPPGFEMPIIVGYPRVTIKPWIDRGVKKWTFFYSRVHLNPDRLSLVAITNDHFITKSIVISPRGVLRFSDRILYDPGLIESQHTDETVALWTDIQKGPRWLCPLEVFTSVHLQPGDDIDEIKWYNPYHDNMFVDSGSARAYHEPQMDIFGLHTNYYDYARECADRFRVAKKIVIENYKKRNPAKEVESKVKFQIGDLVWVSIPLKTDARTASRIALPKKFKFRWAGPMRIVAESVDNNRFTLVETFPDGSVISRQANAARLRHYTLRTPLDSAEKAVANIDDDFEREVIS